MALASNSERREEKQQWSNSPADLLELIFNKLRLISDCIRFGAVCKSWRLASQPTAAGSTLHPQLPLLLLSYHPFTDFRSFFSLSTNSIRTLSLPEARRKKILASSHGWLLLADVTTKVISISSLNPITEAQIQLPPLPKHPTEIDGRSLPVVVPVKVIISSSPISDEHDCIVMMIMCRRWTSGTSDARPGRDNDWTKLKTSSILDSRGDIIC
ncbi:F-box protein SKIP23-like [Elaeis guineensis]|uniref:F-box protein SKIP23-like n=1 Tax=Elaeis guineensis var. tenera TaxID=51953 RepID=UPI003C6CFE7D